MAKKLFVGSMSWNTTDEGLRSAFAPFGEIVEAVVVKERGTGRSRGFGFVTFAKDDDATKAMTEMNGKELDGRTLNVNEARERPQGGGGGDRGGERRFGPPRDRRDRM